MKYRIIKRGNGRYEVQSKEGFFDTWRKEYIYCSEVEAKYWDDVEKDRCTKHLCVAQEFMQKLIEKNRLEKLKEKYEVIEVSEV